VPLPVPDGLVADERRADGRNEAEGGVIHHHAGIQGGADLVPAVHGWDVDEPVAEITVERIA